MRSKSVPSLIAGLGFAAVYGTAGALINGGQCKEGHALSAAASVALLGVMGPKFAKTRAIFPAGVLTAAALPSAVYDAYKAHEWWSAE